MPPADAEAAPARDGTPAAPRNRARKLEVRSGWERGRVVDLTGIEPVTS